MYQRLKIDLNHYANHTLRDIFLWYLFSIFADTSATVAAAAAISSPSLTLTVRWEAGASEHLVDHPPVCRDLIDVLRTQRIDGLHACHHILEQAETHKHEPKLTHQ